MDRIPGIGRRPETPSRRKREMMPTKQLLLACVSVLAVEAFINTGSSLVGVPGSKGSTLCFGRGGVRNAGLSLKLSMSKPMGGHENSKDAFVELKNIGRREMMFLIPALFALTPVAARAETAAMGADTLDRPEFRKYQDFKREKIFVPGADGNLPLAEIPIPFNGKSKKLGKLLGTGATLVVNVKLDDPETVSQIPSLRAVMNTYSGQGLNALCFPTDQGDYEPDDSPTLAQQFGLKSSSKGPVIVTDKTDLVGRFAHPLYQYMTTNMPNPNNITRITLNYEKFLLGPDGKVLRRYPRKWNLDRVTKDIEAVLAGKELPPADPQLLFAWSEANKEATRSMYSFRKHYNFYDQEEAGTDWAGTKSEIFTPGTVEARFKRFSKGKPLEIPVAE